LYSYEFERLGRFFALLLKAEKDSFLHALNELVHGLGLRVATLEGRNAPHQVAFIVAFYDYGEFSCHALTPFNRIILTQVGTWVRGQSV
jgi:hypothetical protein